MHPVAFVAWIIWFGWSFVLWSNDRCGSTVKERQGIEETGRRGNPRKGSIEFVWAEENDQKQKICPCSFHNFLRVKFQASSMIEWSPQTCKRNVFIMNCTCQTLLISSRLIFLFPVLTWWKETRIQNKNAKQVQIITKIIVFARMSMPYTTIVHTSQTYFDFQAFWPSFQIGRFSESENELVI